MGENRLYKVASLPEHCVIIMHSQRSTKTRQYCHYVFSAVASQASCTGDEEREPGTHCSHMRQVPLVT